MLKELPLEMEIKSSLLLIGRRLKIWIDFPFPTESYSKMIIDQPWLDWHLQLEGLLQWSLLVVVLTIADIVHALYLLDVLGGQGPQKTL